MHAFLNQLTAVVRKFVTLLLAILLVVLAVPAATLADVKADSDDLKTLGKWIIDLQYKNPYLLSDGAIKIHHDPGGYNQNGIPYFRVVPYFTNLALVGLLESLQHGDVFDAIEKWIHWYLNHLKRVDLPYGDGYGYIVYDFWYRADGTEETTCLVPPDPTVPTDPKLCDYDDASDSTAATFLGLVWSYYEERVSTKKLTPEFLTFLINHKEDFENIARVILGLQDSKDNLTWAKAKFPVKYLMDNSEVYWGFQSMANLEKRVFRDNRAAKVYEGKAKAVRDSINTRLFDKETGLYHVAMFEDGSVQPADFTQWYPGTVALAWPHLFGVANPASAVSRDQMSALNKHWPIWPFEFADSGGFPWASIGFAALVTGDWGRAGDHFRLVKNKKFAQFPWPFTVDDAGWLLRTLSYGSRLLGVNRSGLSVVSQLTGKVVGIGNFNLNRFEDPSAMAVRPSDQTIFIWNNSPSGAYPPGLLSMDTTSGLVTEIGPSLFPIGELQALAFAPDGRLFGLSDRLYEIDTSTGETTLIGPLGSDHPGVVGADFRSNGILYGLTAFNELVTINTITGEASFVSPPQKAVRSKQVGGSIAFDPQTDMLIGTGFDGFGESILFDIDPGNGVVSNIRLLLEGGGAPEGLGFLPARPVPGILK